MNDRELQRVLVSDPRAIAWTRGLRARFRRGTDLRYDPSGIRTATYRPFQKMHLYLDPSVIEVSSRTTSRFPGDDDQRGIFIAGPSSSGGFAALMVDRPSDLHLLGSGHVLDRWRFKAPDDGALDLDALSGPSATPPGRIDNITDATLHRFRAAYGDSITKDSIFSYVYGLLHSPDYRERYADDLNKMLPRIPLVEDATPYIDAGVRLAALHLGYESQAPYPLIGLDARGPGGGRDHEFFRVEKMRFGSPTSEQKAAGQRKDLSTVVYNSRITLSGIPEDAHRYRLGSRSAIEWVIDRYRVTTDTTSGIVNDPNDWSREVGNPRYVLDLLARIVTVSVETIKFVDALPPLAIRDDQMTERA